VADWRGESNYFFQTHHTSGWTLNAKHAGRPINNLTYSRVNHAEIIANSEREMKKTSVEKWPFANGCWSVTKATRSAGKQTESVAWKGPAKRC